MCDMLNGFQPAIIEFIFLPVIQRQCAAQHFGGTHHIEKTGAKVTQHPPVKTVLCRGIDRQCRLAEVSDR
ncbi:hypothetical protein D3C81_2171560 [compost metagenome]